MCMEINRGGGGRKSKRDELVPRLQQSESSAWNHESGEDLHRFVIPMVYPGYVEMHILDGPYFKRSDEKMSSVEKIEKTVCPSQRSAPCTLEILGIHYALIS